MLPIAALEKEGLRLLDNLINTGLSVLSLLDWQIKHLVIVINYDFIG